MIPYPDIGPEIVRVGPFAIRWYGLMYALGFAASYLLVRRRLGKAGGRVSGRELGKDFLPSLYSYLVAGLVIGARLGYVLFYEPAEYVRRPWAILAVWEGGMSFHGGLIGTVAAGLLCCRKYRAEPWTVADLIVPTAPIGLGLGRLGNFINGELYGRVTDVPWAMVFPGGGPFPRHPSQLYEFLLEGVLLFTVLSLVKDRMRPSGSLIALFLVLYGVFRVAAEFFREPDPQLGFVLGPFTMGQVLSAIMVAAGLTLFWLRRKRVF
jgi:phosphatidylglycerol:prolipoprotein diacylglycerol transferase